MAKPTLYLTFDDGPYEPATELVLKVLKKHAVPATFFLCCASNNIKEARQYQLIQQMTKGGHALANHGDDHKPMTQGGYRGIVTGKGAMSSEERKNFEQDAHGATQVVKHVVKDFVDNTAYFENLFKRNGKKFPGFMGSRLPGDGRFHAPVVEAIVAKTQKPHFGWHVEFAPNGTFKHVDKHNWNGLSGAASTVADTSGLKDQNILLLHDSHWKQREDVLDRLVGSLKSVGKLELLPSVMPKNANDSFKKAVVAPGQARTR